MLKEKPAKSVNKHLLDQWIKDYHWMVNTVKKMRNDLTVVGAKTAQYGIEATMPRAAGSTSDPILSEVNRRAVHLKRIKDYEYKIVEVQKRIEKVTTDREAEVLFWLLEGKSMRWVGKHMALSHVTISNIKENIVYQMLA